MSAIDEGMLMTERGLWRLGGRPSLPPSLAAVIARRLGALSGVERGPWSSWRSASRCGDMKSRS